jgi:hypothetical protein
VLAYRFDRPLQQLPDNVPPERETTGEERAKRARERERGKESCVGGGGDFLFRTIVFSMSHGGGFGLHSLWQACGLANARA